MVVFPRGISISGGPASSHRLTARFQPFMLYRPDANAYNRRQSSRLIVTTIEAITLMLVFYSLEKRSHWFVLAFAASCVLGAAYGFMQGAWPFGLVEAIWSGVALRRWWSERRSAR